MAEKKQKLLKRAFYCCYLIAITIAILEILLRFYYPFQRRIRGDKWTLSTNVVYQLHNNYQPRLDKTVINKRNSIGFRGAAPPADISSRLTILTVGGSTTACTFLTEGKTWTDKLGKYLEKDFPSVWINNAGLDGHSTYGHLNFLYYYLPTLPFRPKVVIFLIGANDVDREDLNSIDSSLNSYSFASLRRWLENHSETVSFIEDLKWIIHPVNIFNDEPNWSFTDFKTVYLTQAYIDSALQKQAKIAASFKNRLYGLADLCRKNNMIPVFVTQPLIFGDGTRQGGNPLLDFHVCQQKENGQLFWKKLMLFNNITRQVSAEKKIRCIDLGSLMPKDTLYYYDMLHFTNAGAEKVADIIFENLNQYLSERFPQYTNH